MSNQDASLGTPKRKWWIYLLIVLAIVALVALVWFAIRDITAQASTPTPTPPAGAAPAATAPVVVDPASSGAYTANQLIAIGGIKAGQTIKVAGPATVLGDVKVNGTTCYDVGGEGEATVVVIMSGEPEIFAEWGAGVEQLPACSNLQQLMSYYKGDELVTGCDGGCETVRLVVVQNGTIVSNEVLPNSTLTTN